MITKTCNNCKNQYIYDSSNRWTQFINTIGKIRKYDSAAYCSGKCAGEDAKRKLHGKGVQDKAKDTIERVYGDRVFSRSKIVRDRIQRTCEERYGTKTPLQNREIRQKTYESNVNNRGGTYHLQTDPVLEKNWATKRTDEYREFQRSLAEKQGFVDISRKACLEKYGVNNFFGRPDLLREKLEERYGISNIREREGVSEKAAETRRLSKAVNVGEFNEEVFRSKFVIDNMFELEGCATYYNITIKSASHFKKKFGITENNRYTRKTLEKSVYDYICSDLEFQEEVVRNDRSVINPLELDLYVPSKNIAIEINGDYWHSEQANPDKTRHQRKSQLCENKGIRLIHVWEHEWLSDVDSYRIKKMLRKILSPDSPKVLYGRKCVVKEISQNEFDSLASENHLLGTTKCPVRLGLYFGEELVACQGYRRHERFEWELARYVNADYAILGGAEKMFDHFLSIYNPKSCVSYVDFSKFYGKVDLKMGFNYIRTTEPTNSWVMNGERLDRRTARYRYQRELSWKDYETWMLKNAFKIWDSGKKVMVWTKPT